MTYRVIQWTTGDLARKAVAGIVGHPALDLVGAWVHSEEKEGLDVGELCGMTPVGVRATRNKQDLYDMEADCVCYMAGPTSAWIQDPMPTVEELALLLRSGKNVANATWPSLVYPQALGDEVHEMLLEACLEGGTTLYTGGIDPGYGSSGLALAALNVTSEVMAVRTFEIMNYAGWDHPDMLSMLFSFGETEPTGVLFRPGSTTAIYSSSLQLIARAMGVLLDDIVEEHEVVRADETFDIPSMRIGAGTICGVRRRVEGTFQGQPLVTIEHVTKLRDQDFPDVDFAGDGYRAVVIGEPNTRIDMSFDSELGDVAHAGYVACAMAVVNAIPQVCEAEPGILTILDLPPYPSSNVVRRP